MKRPTRLAAASTLLLAAQGLFGQPAEVTCADPTAKEHVHLGDLQSDLTLLLELRESRRVHYERIVGVVGSLLSELPPLIPRQIEAKHDVSNLCTQMLMVSQPPKILLAVTIEGVRYQVILEQITPPPPQ